MWHSAALGERDSLNGGFEAGELTKRLLKQWNNIAKSVISEYSDHLTTADAILPKRVRKPCEHGLP